MSSAPPRLLKPELYEQREDGPPALLGGRCECGYVFFPMQTFGCEQCGRRGAALQPMSLRGRGRLRAAATVHVHADEKRPAPFVIGTIALDDGPVIRTLLLDAPPDEQAPGKQVEAVLVPVEGTPDVLDLRFRVVNA
jgi:uncharacterized OB-fold protein